MWDNLVIEQAQNNDWMTKRSEKSTVDDKRKFVTIAQDNMKLCIFHRKVKNQARAKRALSKAPRNLGLADTVFYERFDCTTFQLCGDSQVISKWINGDFTVGGKYQKNLARFRGSVSKVEQNLSRPIVLIGSCVNHIFREHSKEEDHCD